MNTFTKYITKELLLSIFIVVVLVITMNVLKKRSTEGFEDGELISLQNFKTIVAKGAPGEQGPKGDTGNKGDVGNRGARGADTMEAIKNHGKMWLGGLNSGKAGNNLDGETQLYLGGAFNSGANNGREGETTYKLMIEGYDNNGSTVYPIICKDKGGMIDLSLKNREKPYKKPELYLAGDLKLGAQSMIHSTGEIRIQSNREIKLISKSVNKGVVVSKGDMGNGNLRVEGKLEISNVIGSDASNPANTSTLEILQGGDNDNITSNFVSMNLGLADTNNTLTIHSDKEVFNLLVNTNNSLKLNHILKLDIKGVDKHIHLTGRLTENPTQKKLVITLFGTPDENLTGTKEVKVTRIKTNITDVSKPVLNLHSNLSISNDLEVNGNVYFKNFPNFGNTSNNSLELSAEGGVIIKRSNSANTNDNTPLIQVDDGVGNQNHMRVKSGLYVNSLRYLEKTENNDLMFDLSSSAMQQPMHYTELTNVNVGIWEQALPSQKRDIVNNSKNWCPIISGYAYSEDLAQALVPTTTTGNSNRSGSHTHTVPGYTIDMPQGVYFKMEANKWKLVLEAPVSISDDIKVLKVLNIMWIRKPLFLA